MMDHENAKKNLPAVRKGLDAVSADCRWTAEAETATAKQLSEILPLIPDEKRFDLVLVALAHQERQTQTREREKTTRTICDTCVLILGELLWLWVIRK